MHTHLPTQLTICIRALYLYSGIFDISVIVLMLVEHRDTPALALSKTRIHAKQNARPVFCVLPSGSCIKRHYGTRFIVRTRHKSHAPRTFKASLKLRKFALKSAGWRTLLTSHQIQICERANVAYKA